jgi:hypothetical protein
MTLMFGVPPSGGRADVLPPSRLKAELRTKAVPDCANFSFQTPGMDYLQRMKRLLLLSRTASLAWLAFACAAVAQNSATHPGPRDPKWVQRHEGFVEDMLAAMLK